MKKIISEIDKIAGFLEDFEEPWSFETAWKLDRIAQQLSEYEKKSEGLSKISNSILSQYLDNMIFLSENNNKLKDIILSQNNKNASIIYKVTKEHFGKLSKDESINFIKNILKGLK